MKCLERKHFTMGHGLYTATSGAVARRTQLDIIANNLANASTTGFRAQRVVFQEVLRDQNAPGRSLVEVGRPMVSRERGAIEQTGRDLDITLQEEGFLVAQDAAGQVLLKSVSAHVDADGSLLDSVGRRIAFAGGQGFVDSSLPIKIGDHGEIIQQGREVARLLMVDVIDPRALSPVGAGAYLPTSESGQTFPVSAKIVSGALERSNVNPVTNMVNMISLERDYQSLIQVVSAYKEADDGIISASDIRR